MSLSAELQEKLKRRQQREIDGTLEESFSELGNASLRSLTEQSDLMSADLKAAMDKRRAKSDDEDRKLGLSSHSRHRPKTTGRDDDCKSVSSEKSGDRQRKPSSSSNNNSAAGRSATNRQRSLKKSDSGSSGSEKPRRPGSTSSSTTTTTLEQQQRDKRSGRKRPDEGSSDKRTSGMRRQDSVKSIKSLASVKSAGDLSSDGRKRTEEGSKHKSTTFSGDKKPSSSRRRRDEDDSEEMDATEATDTFPTSPSRFGGGADAFAAFPASSHHGAEDDDLFGAAGFGTAPILTEFGSPAAFSDFAFGQDNTSSFGGDAAFGSGAQMFQKRALTVAETIWDKSPLVDIPPQETSKLELVAKIQFSAKFLGKPITNPLNGNILFARQGKDGVYLHEVNPHRNYIQVLAAPILTAELYRRILTKYNASPVAIHAVVAITSGIHHAHGQARLRVAAVVDVNVVESKQTMRIVAVWQWGYASPHPVALQFALTLPSGGEFVSDPQTLQVAGTFLVCREISNCRE
jgi:hypothetical protein